jgi:hypothetical protein
MKPVRPFVPLLACLSIVVGIFSVEVARADPDSPATYFFDCSGPAGTPTSFYAVREAGSVGSGYHLTDGTAIFVVVIFDDVTSGVSFSPPGLSQSGNVTTTCTVTSSISGDTLLLSGFLTPVS